MVEYDIIAKTTYTTIKDVIIVYSITWLEDFIKTNLRVW